MSMIRTPYKLSQHKIRPGMRVDITFIAPAAGERIFVRQMKGPFSFPLCSFSVIESDLPNQSVIPVIPLNPIPKLDLNNAELIDFVFEWEGMSKDNIPAPLVTPVTF